MSIKGPEDVGISKTTFFAGSLAVFASGLLLGVHRVMKKEKASLNIRSQRPEIFLAARALGWGTALCFGAFAAGGAVFSYTTKVTNLQEFDVWARQVGLSVPLPKAPDTPESRAEVKEIEDDINYFMDTVIKGKPDEAEGSKE